MGLFGKKQAAPVFTQWPKWRGPEYGLFNGDLHELKLEEDARYWNLIGELDRMVQREQKTTDILGRVVATPSGLMVESWGQWIGRIGPNQARIWQPKIEAVGGWVWGVFHVSQSQRGHVYVYQIEINKTAL